MKNILTILSALILVQNSYSTNIDDFKEYKRYDNYSLFEGIPIDKYQLDFFKNIVHLKSIDYWKPPGSISHSVLFTLNPKDSTIFEKHATSLGIKFKIVIEDVQSAFDQQTVKNYTRRNMDSFDWKSYFNLQDIYNWLRDVALNYPNKAEIFKIGTTYEGREIIGLKLVFNEKAKDTVFIEGGIHAREWISPAVVTYIINALIDYPSTKNKKLKIVAERYIWYFVPLVNPDGYIYTHLKNRMWRKNRHRFFLGLEPIGCGVDLNRNFGYAFATTGSSNTPTDPNYCGPDPFSELETKALVSLIKSISHDLKYYINFHSFGQVMIIPYAHSNLRFENYDEVLEMGQAAAAVLKKRYGTKYKVGTAADTIGYTISGVSCCWAKNVFKIPYVLSIELRDTGRYGFALPTEQILPTCEETVDGLVSFLTPREKFKARMSNSQSATFLDSLLLFICYVMIYIIT